MDSTRKGGNFRCNSPNLLPKTPPNANKRFQLWQVIFALNTSTQNLADEHTLADGPPQWIEHRCLEYCHTKLGRQTYIGWWIPPSTRAEIPWIPVHKTWQMNLLWLKDPPGNRAEMPWIPVHKTWQMNLLWLKDPPGNRAEMPSIPVHKTWQMNLLWLMEPPVPEERCLESQYTILGRLTYSGQWTPQGNRAEMPSHCYWHQVVQNGNFTLLLMSSGQERHFPWLLMSSGQKWQFHIPTDWECSRMAISHCYWHLVVNNGNFTLLLTSIGQEWQFHIATDILWSTMAISHCYWHLVVNNGTFTLLLT